MFPSLSYTSVTDLRSICRDNLIALRSSFVEVGYNDSACLHV